MKAEGKKNELNRRIDDEDNFFGRLDIFLYVRKNR